MYIHAQILWDMSDRKKQKKLTKKQLDILYECWKDAETHKERLKLIK